MSSITRRSVFADWPLRHLLQRAGHALRLRGPLADEASAKLLHYLLLGFAASLSIELVAMPFWPRKAVAATVVIFMSISALASLALLQRGYFRSASWVYLSAMWVISTVIIILGGGAHSEDQVFYIALSISAAWLVGYRAALSVAGICVLSLLIMAVLEVKGLTMPHYFPGEPIPTWVNFVVAMVIAAVPVGWVLQILKTALLRSQEAEAALLRHQEHLEELVQRRTAELVEARDQARAARDQANAANQAKSLFLANMSHELRTPLNAILGFSALVRTDGSLSDEHRKDLEIVGSSGEHLLGLIDDVLDMAKIEAGTILLDSTAIDLHALVHTVVAMMRPRANAKGLELPVQISPALPQFVCSDPGKLRQILINLLGNAVKYTEQGSITLSLDSKPAAGTRDLLLIFDVEDTGNGIAPDDQVRIFDPFVQSGTPALNKGAGLGLSICRHFVELLGGIIRLDSTPGRGSHFHVEVPAKVVEASEVTAETASLEEVVGLQPGQPEYRILVVEDQKENWVLLQRLLQNAGFKVRVAENADEGLELFQSWGPDFIWMDLGLPGIGGLEAAKRIREMKGGAGVKIAAVTASAFTSQRNEVLAAGMDDFLRKPYRAREIFDCMARHLGARYLYRPAFQALCSEPPLTLHAEDVQGLTEDLREELENALVSLNVERIELLVRQASEQNATTGAVLARLTESFAYTSIVHALESCKANTRHARA